ncbi:VanZ family protein [Mycetocola reblochoni]|uniref:VanZ family protein n=1 Tax=Mycetocola reblochoni TaxID=331618 RepID=A0A3L6ZMN4_9MICO|nr:VanZ family protein [Mycetocola reblochoni]RLP69123.1 VanZ family protein [Mycetocola reblochoni]
MTPGPSPSLRRGRSPRQTLLVAAGVLCLAAIAAICLWPQHVDAELRAPLGGWLDSAHRNGLPSWIGYATVESLANVALYLPAAAIAGALVPPRFVPAVPVAALLLSVGVELTQDLLLPGRTGDPRDVLANTAGAAIGAAMLLLIRRRRRRRAGTAPATEKTPGPGA